MEIASSPKLISTVVLNNTNNNSEISEADHLTQLDQLDTFAVLEHSRNEAQVEMFATFSDSSQNRVIDDSNATSSGNDNDYPNPQIEFCFCSDENFGSQSLNQNSDIYDQCDNKASFTIGSENRIVEEEKEFVELEVKEVSTENSIDSSGSCDSSMVNIGDKKDVVDNKDIIEFYHDSQWNPKNSSGSEGYKNNVNDLLALNSEHELLEERSLTKNKIEEVELSTSIDTSNSSSSSKSSIVHLDEEKGGIKDKENIEFSCDESSANVNKNEANINTW